MHKHMSEAARADLAKTIKALADGNLVTLGDFTDPGTVDPSLADEQGAFLFDLALLLERDGDDPYSVIRRVFEELKNTPGPDAEPYLGEPVSGTAADD